MKILPNDTISASSNRSNRRNVLSRNFEEVTVHIVLEVASAVSRYTFEEGVVAGTGAWFRWHGCFGLWKTKPGSESEKDLGSRSSWKKWKSKKIYISRKLKERQRAKLVDLDLNFGKSKKKKNSTILLLGHIKSLNIYIYIYIYFKRSHLNLILLNDTF